MKVEVSKTGGREENGFGRGELFPVEGRGHGPAGGKDGRFLDVKDQTRRDHTGRRGRDDLIKVIIGSSEKVTNFSFFFLCSRGPLSGRGMVSSSCLG